MERSKFALLVGIAFAAGCGSSEPGESQGSGGSSAGGTATNFVPVDFQSAANAKLADQPGLPSGSQRFNGVDFLLGPGYVQTGSNVPAAPISISIPIGRRFRKLHVLHATHGGGYQQPGHPKHEQDGAPVGVYLIHYDEGPAESMPLVYGDNLRDWWNWDQMRATPGAQVAWVGDSPAAKKFNVSVRLYMAAWENPYPDRFVRTIDLVSSGAKAAPFCVAMTLEDASEAVSVGRSLRDRQRVSEKPAYTPQPAAPPAALPPDIVEDRRRQQEEFEAQRLRNEWASQVNALKRKRAHAFDTFTDELEKSLIAAALRASDVRDRKSQSRLAEERNDFARDRARLPASPEVRDAALQYAQQRTDEEQRLLVELQTLQSKTPAQATDSERRELAEELTAASDSLKRLVARRAEIATMPRPTINTAKPPATAAPTTSDVATTPTERDNKEFLGPPPENWAVIVDPPKEQFTVPANLGYEVLEDVRASLVLYPLGQSVYLASGKGQADVEGYTIYDLRTGQVSGEARGFSLRPEQSSLEGPVLSRDGTYLALPDSFEKKIMVGDVRRRKAVATLTCDLANPAVLFPAADRLLAIDAGNSQRAQLWELPSGKSLLSFTLADEPASEAGKALCSPGGKFLAHIAREGGSDSEVHFYDLAGGKLAGKLQIDGGSHVKPRFSAIAFSADGSEFAAYAFGQKDGLNAAEVMVCWDLATGRPVYQQVIRERMGQGMLTGANYTEPLQWFPDGQGWLLFQRYVIDRKTAAVTQTVQTPGEANYSTYGTKILDDRRVIISDILNKFRVVTVKRTREQ